jgi:hypothetical protein
MKRSVPVVAAVLLLHTILGCNIRPDPGPPGTVYHQRSRAVIHDPFPSRHIGPEIEGARPMEFDRPLAEPEGNQTNPYANRGAFGF